jgi:hypothetical protein
MNFLIDTLNIIDIITFILLAISSVCSWKIYKLIPASQIGYLFVGFALMTILQIGFIVINYLPFPAIIMGSGITINRLIGESVVALRVVPLGFIAFGIYNLFKAIKKYLSEKTGK